MAAASKARQACCPHGLATWAGGLGPRLPCSSLSPCQVEHQGAPPSTPPTPDPAPRPPPLLTPMLAPACLQPCEAEHKPKKDKKKWHYYGEVCQFKADKDYSKDDFCTDFGIEWLVVIALNEDWVSRLGRPAKKCRLAPGLTRVDLRLIQHAGCCAAHCKPTIRLLPCCALQAHC